MLALFIETHAYQYLMTASSLTELLSNLSDDMSNNDETYEVIQIHAVYNNEFDMETEASVIQFIDTLKSEKENQCNL